MSNNGNKPMEEEFRSSKTYQILTGAGVPVADQIAQGLGKAAGAVDDALNAVVPTVKRGVSASWKQAQQGLRNAGGPAAPVNTPGNGGYHYTAPAGQPQRTVPASGQTVQTAPAAGRRPQGVTPAPAPQMRTVRRGSRAKWYITAAAALLYAWNLPLYEPVHYLLFGLVLAGAFALSSKLFKGKKEFVPVEEPKATAKPKAQEKPKAEEKPASTGNPEVDQIVAEGNKYLKRLRAANDAIPDEALSEDIDRMEKASADIFRYIADHPEKAGQVRKFMNYYLPTTLKLLGSYQRLAAQSAKGENITSTMFNIAGMMHTVADAFEKQLDALFADEAMDVSADISVFETLLEQEGLAEEKKRTQNGPSQ